MAQMREQPGMASLAGKVAIVTGAASGIGHASALRFAAAGARVLLADLDPNVSDIAEAVGGGAIGRCMDASDESAVAALVREAQDRFGSLDVLFCNAGIFGTMSDVLDQSLEDWTRVLRVNLIGPALAIRYGAPAMAENGGGSIICMASIAALRSGGSNPAYGASKAGVINLVQSSARRFAGSGIRINALCPGLIETPMTQALLNAATADGKPASSTQLNPMLRQGNADEVAQAALFLASDMSSYINGGTITVDGGLSALHPSAPLVARPIA